MAIYVDEFLYRGRAPGSAEPPAWHLTLGSAGEDDFGRPVTSTRTLSVGEAEAAGWHLPAVIAEINAMLAVEIEARRSEVNDLRAELEAKETALQAALEREAKAGGEASA
jgi:hypothetical protein